MNEKETKSTKVIDLLKDLLEQSGLERLLAIQLSQSVTRKGKERLTIQGLNRSITLDSDNGLDRLISDARFLLDKLISCAEIPPALRGDCGSTDLLQEPSFAKACLSAVVLGSSPLMGNKLLVGLGQLEPETIPVAYGSTAGINFAEVLETALIADKAGKELNQRAEVIFDYDGQFSEISRRIFEDSLVNLPLHLRERMINFREAGSALITGRIKATTELINRIDGLPKITLVDLLDEFRSLGERFSLGQLLALARIAGNDPVLFYATYELRTNAVLDGLKSRSRLFQEGIDSLIRPVCCLLDQENLRPGGLTCYALQTILSKEKGVVVLPFKLTPNANIYKILQPVGALFDGQKGAILAPISRLRIRNKNSDQPIDPMALAILALDQPSGFERLINGLKDSFQVLKPDQAIQKGVGDTLFLIENYFNLEKKDE